MKSFKMKKALVSLSALAFVFSAFSVTAFAEETSPDSTTASIEFIAGQLTLTEAPSFDFGSNAISAATTEYSPSTSGNSGTLSISDLRGSGEGWNVTAALSPFQNSGNGSLAGASLSLKGSAVNAGAGTTSTAPVVETNIVLTSDNTAVAVESASSLTGQGVWNTTWSTPTLKVLGGTAQAGQNNATIDWTLSDAP